MIEGPVNGSQETQSKVLFTDKEKDINHFLRYHLPNYFYRLELVRNADIWMPPKWWPKLLRAWILLW